MSIHAHFVVQRRALVNIKYAVLLLRGGAVNGMEEAVDIFDWINRYRRLVIPFGN